MKKAIVRKLKKLSESIEKIKDEMYEAIDEINLKDDFERDFEDDDEIEEMENLIEELDEFVMNVLYNYE